MQRSYLVLLFLILGIIFASGCIGDSELTYEELMEKHGAPPKGPERAEWNRQNAQKDFLVYLQDYTMLEEMTIEEAKRRTLPSPEDEELGFKLIDYGETTIEGVNVYFVEYTGFVEDRIDAEYLFEINNRWYSIKWRDQLGNPNRGIIDSQISRIIRDAKKVV